MRQPDGYVKTAKVEKLYTLNVHAMKILMKF
jgi:hypothetical protein